MNNKNVIKGFRIKLETHITKSPKNGMRPIIELTKPTKLIIPTNGTTAIFAKTLYGVNVLK